MTKAPLTLYLAAPRGFCAGVDRAIKIVELALEKWGAPVFVRHEIVHNKYVVDDLKAKGAVFVEELDECPDDRPVIFSAHGVPKAVPAAAARAFSCRRSRSFALSADRLVSKELDGSSAGTIGAGVGLFGTISDLIVFDSFRHAAIVVMHSSCDKESIWASFTARIVSPISSVP